MLQFVIGTAGTGKTRRIIEKIETAVEAGDTAVFIVPEQFSFEAERLLYRALGPKGMQRVEVLSLTRLCESIFRRFGGLAGVAVSEAGKYMLMSVALTEVTDHLQIYRKSAVNPSFLQVLVATCGELKTAGISPSRLEELVAACGEGDLRDKLTELSLIYSAYQGLLDRGYSDPDDTLMRASGLLERHDFFQGVCVFVDGFTTFMAAEFALLGQMIGQAKEITFALTTDGIHDAQQGIGVFSAVKAAAARLIRCAAEQGVKVAAPETLMEQHRYCDPALRYLSTSFLQPGVPPCDQQSDCLHLFEAESVYREAEYVAASIVQMVRTEGCRYREIAVVARDVGIYRRAVETMFARYDLPYFSDNREEVENLPLISGLLSALDAVRGGFDPEPVLAYAKSPLSGLDPEQVAAMENYCYCWSVRGAVWTAPFANNPRGMAERLTEEDQTLLGKINETRVQVIEPLAALRETLRRTDGRRFAQAVFDFLQATGAADNLIHYAQDMEQGLRESFLDSSAQIWDALMEILDVFGNVLGGVGMTMARACELFRLAVSTAEVAQVPQTLDAVLVGAADRIRPGQVKAVFVIGANEGVFPLMIGGGGLFTDTERRRIIDLGAELSPPTLQQSVLEKFFAYFALTLPSQSLSVSYSRTDPVGREQQPSMIVTQLQELFPWLQAETKLPGQVPVGDKPALELLAEVYREDSPLASALITHLEQAGKAEELACIRRSAENPPHGLTDRWAAGALFGRSLHLSPSRVERYFRCPFSYFAADGLSVKKRRKVEFSPLESGSVIHNVLQVMVQRHGGKGLADLGEEQMKAEIRQAITEYLSGRVEDLNALPARFRYLFTRLTGMLARLLLRMGQEFAQSEFEPNAFELPIGQDGVEPLHLVTADGIPVTVEGFVDRVDVMEKRGRRYVRVVDYKSGAKEFQLHDILYGLNLQMLLYLFTIAENGKGELENAIPAGVLYMPVRERYISGAREMSQEELRKEQEKQWRMNGLLLEDEEVLRGMERDLAGVFIPAKMGKTGLDAKSALASHAEMGRLADKVRKMIVQMASALSSGEIAACPTQGDDMDACAFCDYRAMCGHEQGEPVRTVEKIDKGEFFKLLEEEENG